MVAGIAYATYSWVAQQLMTEGVGPAAAMGLVFGIGGVLLMLVLIITGAPLLATPQSLAVGGYMALVVFGVVLLTLAVAPSVHQASKFKRQHRCATERW